MSDDLQAVNPRARLFRIILSVYGIGIYIFLFAPIAVLILLSFNSSTVVGFPMAGFTTDWYVRLSHDAVILDALEKSLIVAFWVTVLATLIGTAAAFPLVRANIKNRGGVRVFITLPIMMPGLLIGVAILVLATNVLHMQPPFAGSDHRADRARDTVRDPGGVLPAGGVGPQSGARR